MEMSRDSGFILRLGSEAESRLFANRWIYVGVKRGWERGTKVLFENKLDGFTGLGVVSRIQTLAEMDSEEREMCLSKNMCAKLHFETLIRFHPRLPIKDTPLSNHNTLTLHGSNISSEMVELVEALPGGRIIM